MVEDMDLTPVFFMYYHVVRGTLAAVACSRPKESEEAK